MELFYIPKIRGSEAVLEEEELHHVTRVLRKSTGDVIRFTDGRGTLYEGAIGEVKRNEAKVEITGHVRQEKRDSPLTVATALTKNIRRMEWAFEKMTEIGVQRIIPMICERSERRTMKDARMQKILTSAMKQSERSYLPGLDQLTVFDEVIAVSDQDRKCIGCRLPESVPLTTHYKPGASVLVLIGPEGDFTDQEIRRAKDAGFQPVLFGHARLRTETAAVFATTCIATLNMTV